MIYLLSPKEVQKADQVAINKYGLPALILMENAARSIAELIKSLIQNSGNTTLQFGVFCGSGNNGGDGFAVARHLVNYGQVFVYWIGDTQKMSPETRTNFDILSKLPVEVIHIKDKEQIFEINNDFDYIIDALIGVGGSEDLRGIVVDILDFLNNCGGVKIAVDVPTGLNSETGAAHSLAFVADYTVSMFAIKTGMVIGEGPNLCGNIIVGNLGAPNSIVTELSNTFILERNELEYLLPVRYTQSSKFDYGKALMIGGSLSMPGAPALMANACIKSGAGLVYLFSPKIHSQTLPEVIPLHPIEFDEQEFWKANLDYLIEFANKMAVVAIGPGMGINTNKTTMELVKNLISKVPLILDADALTNDLLEMELNENVLLTPHIGEFSRIIGISRDKIAKNPIYYAKKWAKKLNCNILLKGSTTVITNGTTTFINNNGTPALATAGSGDVLTGIIAGLVAQGKSIFDAAVLGAFLHGMIGEYYTTKIATRGLTASKMIDLIEVIYNEIEQKSNH